MIWQITVKFLRSGNKINFMKTEREIEALRLVNELNSEFKGEELLFCLHRIGS